MTWKFFSMNMLLPFMDASLLPSQPDTVQPLNGIS